MFARNLSHKWTPTSFTSHCWIKPKVSLHVNLFQIISAYFHRWANRHTTTSSRFPSHPTLAFHTRQRLSRQQCPRSSIDSIITNQRAIICTRSGITSAFRNIGWFFLELIHSLISFYASIHKLFSVIWMLLNYYAKYIYSMKTQWIAQLQ